jgi:hypothetical protein
MRRLTGLGLALGLLPALLLATSPADARTTGAQVSAAQSARPLVIDETHWGPLRLGMTVAKAQRTGLVSAQRDHCAPGYLLAQPYRDHGFLSWSGPAKRLHLAMMIVTDGLDHTAAGVHVGDTLGRLEAAYPHLSAVTQEAKVMHEHVSKTDSWVASVRSKKGTINFQFPFGKRPTSSTRIETIVVSAKPTFWFGC